MEPTMLHLLRSSKISGRYERPPAAAGATLHVNLPLERGRRERSERGGRSHARPSDLRVARIVWLCVCVVCLSQLSFAQVTWNFLGPSGFNGPQSRVLALASDPRNDSVIYLASPGGGVWKTMDGGTTWSPQLDGALSPQVCSLVIDPQSPDVVYLGTGDDQSPRPDQGVARSADGGRNWTFGPRFTDQAVCAIAVDPLNSSRVLAGSAEGLFVSLDAGTSWTSVLSTPVTSISFDGQGSVYAGMLGENVLARSSDGGRTWSNLSLPSGSTLLSKVSWVSVAAAADNLGLVVSYPATSGSLSQIDFYRSTDRGSTWSALYGLGQARPPISLVANPDGNSLYVAAASLLASPNNGLTWQTIPMKTSEFHAVAPIGGTVIAAGEQGLDSPARVVSQLPIGQFLKLSADSLVEIWAGGPGGLFGFFNGSRYSETGVAGIRSVGSVVAATANTNIFAAGNNAVYTSTDEGVRFSARTVIADGELRAPFPPLILDPINSATAYVAGKRAYRTTNSGNSWTALGTVDPDATHVVIALAMPPASRTTLYAATACLPEVSAVACPSRSWVWRSANAGDTWVQVSVVNGFVNKLTVDSRQPNTIYAAIGAFPAGPGLLAGLTAGDLLQSTTAGTAWTSIRGNLPRTSINTVLIDPTSLPPLITLPAQTLYAGTDAGVFVTFNGGTVWTDISSSVTRSLPASPVTDLILLPDRTLVAATFGRGVYSTSVAGLASFVTVNPLYVDVTLTQGTTITSGVPMTNTSLTMTAGWRLNALDPWISVPAITGILTPLASTQAEVRISAVGLGPGTHRGRLQMVSGPFAQNIYVDAHVSPAPAQITIVSGDNVVGGAGTALPLQVMISDARKLPLPGAAVTFSIVSGGGLLSLRSVATNAAGVASTILTLPANPGTTKITAASGAVSVTLTATAVPAPTLLNEFIIDGVTFNSFEPPGPGSIISISSQNLSEVTVIAGSTLLPTILQSTRVVLITDSGEIFLPLLSVSPFQIRALLPFNLTAETYRLRVEVASGRSNEVAITIAAFAPGIFTRTDNGRGPGIFMKQDGSLVTATNPADRGGTVSFFAAGLGAVTPSIAAGQPGSTREPLNRTVATPRVFFDTYPADLVYSGLAPGSAGRYLVTVRVPAFVQPATNVSVSLTIGGYTSNRVTIPVR